MRPSQKQQLHRLIQIRLKTNRTLISAGNCIPQINLELIKDTDAILVGKGVDFLAHLKISSEITISEL